MDLDKKLIKEVQTHSVLYDPNHGMYKDVEHKHRVWMQIGRKLMGGEDENISGDEFKSVNLRLVT